jgi:predicted NBD/HSP70 family sugar kinase
MYIAIDIGGTKTLLALFSEKGRLLKRLKMKSYQEQDKWLKELSRHLHRVLPLRRKTVKAVTISYPGVLTNGHPGHAINLPKWDGPAIEACIKSLFNFNRVNCNIYYKNDADLGALYECHGYSGKTVYLTFGTGIGGGIVRYGHLSRESANFEPGHIVKSYKGKRAEWEKIASSKAIRAANNDLDVRKISEKKALDDVACRMEVGLTDLIKEHKPDQIVLSGPIVSVFPGFHDTLVKLLQASLGNRYETPPIYPAKKPQESVVSPKTLNLDNLKNTNIPKNAYDFLVSLSLEYPQFSWRLGDRFKYKPEKTIIVNQNETIPMPHFALLTLHELGHALSNHKDYKTDVERLRIESEAWQRAKSEISKHPEWKKYTISYDEDFAENELDSYRDWLHQKSKCKKCGLTKYQTTDGIYHCPNCENEL